jgi:predicted MFS family arabinose efflux permease
MQETKPQQPTFTQYEKFIITILTILQFTIILDFMVLSPLGAILMPTLKISPAQFAMVVSAYAISAGLSGFLAAGFADKFDRKKMLMFFYTGFIIGTFLCGIAKTYDLLLGARIFTGIFGGVIGSISFAIVTDLFKLEVRGRVMGFLQMAFAGSQVLGIPIGFYFANKLGWHFPFLMIVGVSVVVWVIIAIYLKPINAHLHANHKTNPLAHFANTISNPSYIQAFAATVLLATGGFMLMPFASAYSVNNMGIDINDLTYLYVITGICSMAAGPVIGKFTDTYGKFRMFLAGTILTIVIVLIYCNLGITPFWGAVAISVTMFTGVSSRIISSSALLSAVPAPQDRGAFMGINASIQQISGGLAAVIAGQIVVQSPTGKLGNYDILGYVVVGAMLITVYMVYLLDKMIKRKLKSAQPEPAMQAKVA